jgi:hypothetical protein
MQIGNTKMLLAAVLQFLQRVWSDTDITELLGFKNKTYARQHLKMASDRMKTRYNRLANSGLPRVRLILAMSPNPHQRRVALTSILLEGPLHRRHPNQGFGGILGQR